MAEDLEALLMENQMLRKAYRRWQAVALAALATVFAFLIPFTIAINQVAHYYELRARIDAMREIESLEKSQ